MIQFKNSSDGGETEHDKSPPWSDGAAATIPSPETPPGPTRGHRLSAPLCSKCISMTATTNGLRDLFSPGGYTHHNVSNLKITGENGCAFCKSVFKILSSGKLRPAQDGQRLPVALDERLQTMIFAYCEGVDRSSPNSPNAPVLKLLKHIVVRFINDGVTFPFLVPVSGMSLSLAAGGSVYKDKILAFQAFTELSEHYYVCEVEIAGESMEALSDTFNNTYQAVMSLCRSKEEI
jgi:hypothetical protein